MTEKSYFAYILRCRDKPFKNTAPIVAILQGAQATPDDYSVGADALGRSFACQQPGSLRALPTLGLSFSSQRLNLEAGANLSNPLTSASQDVAKTTSGCVRGATQP